MFWWRLRRRWDRWRVLLLQEIKQRSWGDEGGRGEGAVLQLPTDGVVHEGVTAGVPSSGGREAGEEEGSKEGNSGFSVVTFRVETLHVANIIFLRSSLKIQWVVAYIDQSWLKKSSFGYFKQTDYFLFPYVYLSFL